ncbi:MAG: hypothetical protein ACRDPA_18730 [Solirubrobacteraceae bacterium]
MWANRRLASVSVHGDDPNMRPGQIIAAPRLRRAAKGGRQLVLGLCLRAKSRQRATEQVAAMLVGR